MVDPAWPSLTLVVGFGQFCENHPPPMCGTRGSSHWLHLFADMSPTASLGPHAHSRPGPSGDHEDFALITGLSPTQWMKYKQVVSGDRPIRAGV